MSEAPRGRAMATTPATPVSEPGGQGAGRSAPRAGGWLARVGNWAPVCVPSVVMAVLGTWGIARQSAMGNDEIATRWAAMLSLSELGHLLIHVDAVHGLYYLLIHAWVVVGSSPAVLRVPSVIAMVAAVALAVVITRRLTSSAWAGLFAGLVMALTPIISFYAQTARSYAMVVTCMLGATLVLIHALEAEAAGRPAWRRWWIGYTALVTLGGYLNEMFLLVLAAHGVTVLLTRQGRTVVRHFIVATAAAVVLISPLMVISAREHAAVSWIKPPTLADVKVLLHDYFGSGRAIPVLLILCAVVAVLPAAFAWRHRERDSAVPPPWWRSGGLSLPSVAAPILVLPAGILLLESRVFLPLYVDRYVLYGEAGAAMLAGAGLYRIGQWLTSLAGDRRLLIWVPGVLACVSVLVFQFGAQQRARMPQSREFDFGTPARYVGARAQAGDGILFFGTFFRKIRLGYPQDFTKVTDLAMAQSPMQAGNYRGTDKPFSQVQPLMLRYQRIWVIGRPPSAARNSGQYRQESLLLLSRYRLISERLFKGMAVTLWEIR